MVEELRVVFDLSDEDMSISTRSGSTTQVLDRINWTLQYLRRAQFVEIKDGRYHITQRGAEFLSSHEMLTINDLLDYKEFAEYSNRKKQKKESKQIEQSQIISERTPTEQLEQAYDSIEKDLVEDLLDKVKRQSPAFFEHLVVDLLVRMGYGGSFENSAQVTQYTNDNGIDGIIYEDKLGLDKIYIQAKRYGANNKVDIDALKSFYASMQGVNKGVFITTSSFTKGAKDFVNKEQKDRNIIMIDGDHLVDLMIKYGIGLESVKTYVVYKLNEDYFE